AVERFLRVVEIGRQQGDAPCPSLAGALGDDGGRARGGGEEALGDSGGSEQSAVGVEELESHTLLGADVEADGQGGEDRIDMGAHDDALTLLRVGGPGRPVTAPLES